MAVYIVLRLNSPKRQFIMCRFRPSAIEFELILWLKIVTETMT